MYLIHLTFPSGSESACNTGDLGSIPGSGRSPGEGNGYPLPYSCLENSMDRAAWQATVHGLPESWIQLSDQDFHFHFKLPNRLAQPTLFRTLPLAYHLTQSLFYDKVLNTSYNLLNTESEKENGCVHTDCFQAYHLFTPVVMGMNGNLPGLLLSQHHKGIWYHTSLAREKIKLQSTGSTE